VEGGERRAQVKSAHDLVTHLVALLLPLVQDKKKKTSIGANLKRLATKGEAQELGARHAAASACASPSMHA
jgi:hypothetical protein